MTELLLNRPETAEMSFLKNSPAETLIKARRGKKPYLQLIE
jgi:hypothetical protein